MIPLKLHLKNFLSYGDVLQTIDFTPYQLICLSGKNGHGKSALLDAITWAIWGQARKIGGVAKPDAHLMRLGQQQMLVMFDFEFNGQQYRIRREFASTHGKQYASLDFGLMQGDKIISLTNKTIRDTQTIIETTLGLDFDAFINSAFLRQGQSNEFSKKSPKERKEILGAILGLNHYELVRKKALDKVKQAGIELDYLKKFQEKNTQALLRLPHLQNELHQIQQSLQAVIQEEERISAQKNSLEKTKAQLNEQKNQQQFIQLQHAQKLQEEEQFKLQIQSCYAQWKNIHKKIIVMGAQSLEQQKKDILLQISVYQQKTQKALTLKEKLLQKKQEQQQLVYRAQIEYQQQLLTHQTLFNQCQFTIDTKKKDIQSLQAQLSHFTNEKNQHQIDLKKLSSVHSHREQLQTTIELAEKKFEKRKLYYHQWITSANLIKSQADQLEHKYTLIYDENNPSCPLCEQTLSASRKRFLKGQFTKQEQFYAWRVQRLTHLIKNLKQLLVEQHTQLNHHKKELEEYSLLQTKQQELLKNLEKLHTEEKTIQQRLAMLIDELTQLEIQAREAEKKLTTLIQQEHSFKNTPGYLLVQQEIEILEQEARALAIDDTTFALLRQRQLELEQESNQLETFQQEVEKQEQRKNRIHELIASLRTIKTEKKKLLLSLEQFNLLEQSYAQVQQQENTLRISVETIKKEKETLLQKKGYIENEQSQLVKLQEECILQEKKIAELDTTIFEYQAIASAVSKDGVQALIIEDALPEIEQEANSLLSQLTDNQAHIIIESLRDLKKGGTKETLDIKISDTAGIRPYELFSGGEAFRIDFALRLAISKLLARRAGTSLQMLIIDEGFGSQDEDGLHHIMDCIYKIQHNFCKIIIVSHLPSMKEQFPVHFYVEKTSQGSSIRVIEQG